MVEEIKKKKLERLAVLKSILENKKQMAADFKERYNIEFDVLFDPYHPKFNELYSLEDELNENLVMAIKYRSASRQYQIIGAFVGYHVVKSILWRFGYFATFFKRTRFLSIPIFIGANYWNLKETFNGLKEAGVLEYNQKRTRFDRDSKTVEKILQSRLDLAKERQAAEFSTTNIKKLID